MSTRSHLLEAGWSDFQILMARRSNELFRVGPGQYATDDHWQSVAQAALDRGGPQAVLSHETAAALHGFDLFKAKPIDPDQIHLTVPFESTMRWKAAVVHRSRRMEWVTSQLTSENLRVSDRAQTVLDLARSLTITDLEIVVESALRSTDPRTPANWRVDVLAVLESISVRNVAGAGKLRAVLAQRPPGCRPTGSSFETSSLQALRLFGRGDLLRQPTLTVIDETSRTSNTVYPDLASFELGTTIEVDFSKYHAERRNAERRRDNLIGKVVTILRFDETMALPMMARQVDAALTAATRRQRESPHAWRQPHWIITEAANELVIRIPKR
jgi:hypothetical protein